MENNSMLGKEDEEMELPPGFRFYPTDEELITHYLSQKVANNCFFCRAIGEVDLNKCEPWDLPCKAKMGENEWYFFCVRDRKYPTGLRTNRATDVGYWKATGKDREIHKGKLLVGMKKTLVFYNGRAPKGEKTNWVMHEYRLGGNLPKTARNDWVICRVFQKSSDGKKIHICGVRPATLPPLTDLSPNRIRCASGKSHVTCFSIPMEDQKPLETNTVVDSHDKSLLASQPSLDPVSATCFLSSSTCLPFKANSELNDSLFMSEPSILRMLLETHGPSVDLSRYQGAGFHTNMSSVLINHEFEQSSCEDQEEHPSCTVGPVDLDCLWNY